jgi:O-antigen ligase
MPHGRRDRDLSMESGLSGPTFHAAGQPGASAADGRLSRINRVPFLILAAAVAAAPLPFGSTDSAVIAGWCIVLGAAIVLASPRMLRTGHFILLGGAAVIIAAYALVLHEQLSPRPWFASPNALWHDAGDLLGTPLDATVSIARHQPYFAVGAPLAAMLALVCSLVVCADRSRARQLLQVMAWSGAAYAAFGIAQQLIEPTQVLWRDKQVDQTALVATFINRNTAATYFGSCSVVWLLLLCERIRRAGLSKFDLSALPRDAVIAFSMLLVCLAATFMTRSRAGILLSLLALVIAFGAYSWRYLPPRRLLAEISGSGIVALCVLVALGGGVMERFDEQGLTDRGRWEMYGSTLRMIADHPWFGTGLGTFAFNFPAYRIDVITMWGIWDRAHSTPLELAAELGLPLAVMIVAAWVAALAVLIQGIRVRRRDHMIPTAALSVALLALLHSLIDFSLQMPGYAIVVFALTGAGLSQSFPSRNAASP